MHFLSDELEKYVENHTAPESEILHELNRETHLKVLIPRMLSGHVQGRVIATFSHMIKPKRVLEIGTYTGYSALCWAEGLADGGKVVTIDKNAELEKMVRGYFERSRMNDKIDFKVGNAMEIIPTLNEEWDIVFIDADKENYINYYNMVIDHVKPGGFIMADNVLWSGRVLLEENKMDKDTKVIAEYNNLVMKDDRVEPVLFAVRDGIMVCRKR